VAVFLAAFLVVAFFLVERLATVFVAFFLGERLTAFFFAGFFAVFVAVFFLVAISMAPRGRLFVKHVSPWRPAKERHRQPRVEVGEPFRWLAIQSVHQDEPSSIFMVRCC